ncbi:TPA: hypothetical protein ACH3X3_002563 [Trebouxia sp. C0006]
MQHRYETNLGHYTIVGGAMPCPLTSAVSSQQSAVSSQQSAVSSQQSAVSSQQSAVSVKVKVKGQGEAKLWQFFLSRQQAFGPSCANALVLCLLLH